ncbi:hypothetical protein BDY21DRAFT_91942 [Lineolata rhizophorae]|uniref:Uncharacterized protein n=1 Tax=Lineolata rhizophorae TaxID=578093 RepID=A0A6A6PCP9_9PEZI|nr:hypothetical protein BDY21DRAFT_91942 [Lineolata rhizophorae]
MFWTWGASVCKRRAACSKLLASCFTAVRLGCSVLSVRAARSLPAPGIRLPQPRLRGHPSWNARIWAGRKPHPKASPYFQFYLPILLSKRHEQSHQTSQYVLSGPTCHHLSRRAEARRDGRTPHVPPQIVERPNPRISQRKQEAYFPIRQRGAPSARADCEKGCKPRGCSAFPRSPELPLALPCRTAGSELASQNMRAAVVGCRRCWRALRVAVMCVLLVSAGPASIGVAARTLCEQWPGEGAERISWQLC